MQRLLREVTSLERDPPFGCTAWPVDDDLKEWQAIIEGPDETPYKGGFFLVQMQLSDRYPFLPPSVRFVTPVYHPNIDDGGRICLDLLKPQPKGSWAPSVNLTTLLAMIRQLLAQPNPDDPLMVSINELYLNHRSQFDEKARAQTALHATLENIADKQKGRKRSASRTEDPSPKRVCESPHSDEDFFA